MPNYNVTNNIDTLLRSTSNAAARTSLELGDAATKNTGTTAGTVAAGNDSRITGALQTSGGTMTGKLTAAADNTIAKLSVGSRTVGSSPTTLSDGDIWISNQGALSYRDSTGPTSRAVAATSLSNTFNQPQTIGVGAGTALTVNNSGTGTAASIANTATATSDAVVITNLGSGNSLVVNDETTPDSTRFAVANNGRVGIGVTPDASVALSVDTTGIKFGDGTIQTTAGLTGTVQEANGGTGETTYTNGQLLIGNAAGGLTKATLTAGTNVTITNGDGAITINATGGGGGGGTVTSVTAGTGLTGGTITSTGTIAADFGATTGKVTEGGTTVLKAGDTMTGKLTLPAATTTSAPLNVGSSGVQPTSPAVGDVWIRNNLLQYRGSSITVNSVAATAEPNTFSARQAINATDTLPALRVTQLGTGEALRVEDEANPDATAFVVANNGRVGVGVTPDAAVALSVDTSGIKFGDNTTQTTAFTGTASNVTGTVAIANGGTGQTNAANAINALVPSQTGNSGKVLTTNGSVVSWGAAGGGGSGITELTGDVAASGSGSVSATVQKIQGRTVSSAAPSGGQVLGWNATDNRWEPANAGGSYAILQVLLSTPGSGSYSIPPGYVYADIYACSGGGGGGSGASISYSAISGGAGGGHGIFCHREKVCVDNATLSYIIGTGGAGGVPDLVTGQSNHGSAGTGTLLQFSSVPNGGTPTTVIADCGYYINSGGLSGNFGQGASSSSSSGGTLTLASPWLQNVQYGGAGMYGAAGVPPTHVTYSTQTTYVSAGASGGGVDAATSPNTFNGGNVLDSNYMLYYNGGAVNYAGVAGSSSTIDATVVSGNPTFNIFWGGAGGASADSMTAVFAGGAYRAGNGANGGLGCGGGGGGSMYDPSQNSSYAGGSGGKGGDGFILMYLYK
jgi:hypothetical protein